MYEVVNTIEKQNYEKQEKENIKKKFALKYFIRIISVLLAFYLISINNSFSSTLACITLLGTVLFENVFSDN
jgi:hypothetical protein